MKKRNILLTVAAVLGATMLSGVTAFAGQWVQDGTAWKYLNDNGILSAGCWQWIDGNQDGIAECYYFGSDSVMFADAITPDGWRVNADGAWIENGIVQTKESGIASVQPSEAAQYTDVNTNDNAYNRNTIFDNIDEGGLSGTASGSLTGIAVGGPSGTAEDAPSFTVEEITSSSSDSIDTYNYPYKVFELVNQERAAYGRKPLKWADDVAGLAQTRAKEIVEVFEHERSDGRKWSTIFTDDDMQYTFIGENIAKGQTTPEMVVDAWMASPGHKENILREAFEEIGVGCFFVNTTYYWVQLFIAR